MKKPVLVIMAAGMGSRYGGLKQIDPLDSRGHLIIDYSIYDAVKAGFEEIICILKEEMEEDFNKIIGNRIRHSIKIKYIYQRNDFLPDGFVMPEGRVKPWGTGHAVLSCKGHIHSPFAVINADDYYGANAFQMIYQFLSEHMETEYHYAMIGYPLENTLTNNGHVARGVCELDEKGSLAEINERTHIEKIQGGAVYTEDGVTWTNLLDGTLVSMNMWGFTEDFIKELDKHFGEFLDRNIITDPLTCEYFLPFVVDQLLKEQKARVDVLESRDKWYGVTYKEDKDTVVNAIKSLVENGQYPVGLWEDQSE